MGRTSTIWRSRHCAACSLALKNYPQEVKILKTILYLKLNVMYIKLCTFISLKDFFLPFLIYTIPSFIFLLQLILNLEKSTVITWELTLEMNVKLNCFLWHLLVIQSHSM